VKSIAMLAVLLLSAPVAWTPSAHAQPAPGPAQPDAAEAAYREGRRLYDLHEWDAAIAKFKEAYRLRSDPASLFNIAQSYRLKGDCGEASSFYKTYRRNFPTASNIAKVDKFIADLEPCAKPTVPRAVDGRGLPPAGSAPGWGRGSIEPRSSEPSPGDPKLEARPSVGTDKPSTPAPAPTPAPSVRRTPTLLEGSPPGSTPPIRAVDGRGSPPTGSDPGGERGSIDHASAGRTQRLAGLAIAGGGVVAIGLGAVFGLQASARSSDVQSGHGVWDPSLESDGTSAETRAEILWGLGGAAIIAGGVLYYLGRQDAPHVAVQPRTGGAVMVWSCDL